MKQAQSRPNAGGLQSAAAVYGFVAWIVTFCAWLSYLAWAFLPEETLISIGVVYFPSKLWAVALPAYFVVLLLFVGVIYIALNLMRTAPLSSFDLVWDEHSRPSSLSHHIPSAGGAEFSMQQAYARTPEIADLSIKVVNRMLYQNHSWQQKKVKRLYTRPTQLPGERNSRAHRAQAALAPTQASAVK